MRYREILKGCNEHVNVLLPDSITEIQDKAFDRCNLIKALLLTRVFLTLTLTLTITCQ